MLYKEYGKTGKKLSIIGFGGMRFQKENGDYDYDKCSNMLVKASEMGINYFDTAPGYCDRKSEVIFGRAFKQMKGDFYVSTKSGAKTADKLREDLENSLRIMDLQKIDFYHIWCVVTMEDYRARMVPGGPYEAALKAKSEGLIDHVVISTHCNGDEIETIVNEDAYEGITLGYNIMNFPYRKKGLEAAYNKGLGVVTMNPLGGGVIPANENYLSFIKDNEDDSLVESAIRFNASHKEITTVLTGISRIEDVIENAQIGNRIEPLSEERLKIIEKNLFKSMNELCTGCRYCDNCPQGISIPELMLAYNHKIFTSDKTRAINELRWHWGMDVSQASKCIACELCETACTQHLNIIERLEEMASWA